MNESYRFPGIADFVVADSGLHPASVAKIPNLWPVARAVDALSQVPTAPPEARESIMATVVESERMLQSALDTVRAAKREVEENCLPKPKPQPSVTHPTPKPVPVPIPAKPPHPA